MIHRTFLHCVFGALLAARFSFWSALAGIGKSLLGGIGSSILGGLTSGIGGAVSGATQDRVGQFLGVKTGGYKGAGMDKEMQEAQHAHEMEMLQKGKTTRKDIRMGHQEDTRSYKQRDQYDWEQAEDRGLTPQEFYGSAAAGGSASSGGASVLGNSKTEIAKQTAQLGNENRQRALDRQVQIRGQDADVEKARIASQASVASSGIAASAQTRGQNITRDTTTRGQDIQANIAANRLKLDRETFEKVTLPQAAETLNLTEEQTKKAINEVVTSTPKFQRWKIFLQMGVDNVLATSIADRHKVDITKPGEVAKLSETQYAALIAEVLATQSHLRKEAGGIGETASNVMGGLGQINQTGVWEKGAEWLEQIRSLFRGQSKGSQEVPESLGHQGLKTPLYND